MILNKYTNEHGDVLYIVKGVCVNLGNNYTHDILMKQLAQDDTFVNAVGSFVSDAEIILWTTNKYTTQVSEHVVDELHVALQKAIKSGR